MKRAYKRTYKQVLGVIIASSLVTACGGGSSKSSGTNGDVTLEQPEISEVSVSGTVSGLNGELVLSIGGETLSVSENGDVSVDGVQAINSEVDVRVVSQPNDLQCQAVFEQKDFNRLSVDCNERHWQSLTFADAETFGEYQVANVQMVINDNNNGILVWLMNHLTDGSSELWARDLTEGQWGEDYRIGHNNCASGAVSETSFNSRIVSFAVTINNNQNVALICVDKDEANVQISRVTIGDTAYRLYLHERIGSTWSHPESRADTVFQNFSTIWLSKSSIASADNNDVVFTWNSELKNYVSERRAGIWQHPESINDTITDTLTQVSSYAPNVVMNQFGETLIAFAQQGRALGSTKDIFYSEYRNGQWSHHVNYLVDGLAVDETETNNDVMTLLNDQGDAVIGWTTSEHGAFVAHRTNTIWQLPNSVADALSDVDALNPESQNLHGFMDDSGNISVVWSQNTGILMAQYKEGHWVLPVSEIDYFFELNKGVSSYPVISGRNDGYLTVAAHGVDLSGTTEMIFLKEFREGTWSTVSFDEPYSPGQGSHDYSYDLKFAMNNRGNAYLTWAGHYSVTDRGGLYVGSYAAHSDKDQITVDEGAGENKGDESAEEGNGTFPEILELEPR
ncbi:hypothetical protein [Litoribrevibacter albus]|uniref:Uncharacterized protein n=1 Tax=Litoribrevibacter albus TaxID=1473156 RepID=A0AA37S958_9GAMM|nr:hypothetical protein [Litoribrevibacter albus]GLQ30424.1 hypothetical protein GCM10007876_09020 [Litoribrevibacter albus]